MRITNLLHSSNNGQLQFIPINTNQIRYDGKKAIIQYCRSKYQVTPKYWTYTPLYYSLSLNANGKVRLLPASNTNIGFGSQYLICDLADVHTDFTKYALSNINAYIAWLTTQRSRQRKMTINELVNIDDEDRLFTASAYIDYIINNINYFSQNNVFELSKSNQLILSDLDYFVKSLANPLNERVILNNNLPRLVLHVVQEYINTNQPLDNDNFAYLVTYLQKHQNKLNLSKTEIITLANKLI